MRKFFWSFLNFLNHFFPKFKNIILLYSGVEYKDNIKAVGDFLYNNHYEKRYLIFFGEYQRKNRFISIAGEKIYVFEKAFSIIIFLFAGKVFYAFNPIPIQPSKKQKVLQMWHGMPLKTIFNANSSVFHKYDFFSYILATSPFFAKIFSDSVPCSIDKVVVMGQPKIDAMVKKSNKVDEKLVFWAPTFRKAKYWNQNDAEMNSYIPMVSNDRIEELGTFLNSLGIRLMVKLHPMESCDDSFEMHVKNIDIFSHHMFEKNGYELYDSLGKAGALITDYSSTFIDYLLLNRPIGFVLENFDSYKMQRGFVFDNPLDYMPGEIINDYQSLLSFFESFAKGEDRFFSKRAVVNKLFNDYADVESNCQAILDFMEIK